MKPPIPLIAGAVLALTLAACDDSPTNPVRGARSERIVAQVCNVFEDPNCNPAIDPVTELVEALANRINALTLSPIVKARLIGYVNQIPTRLEALTPDQRLHAIRSVQSLIGFVQLLTPRLIPAPSANEIIALANQLIAALSY